MPAVGRLWPSDDNYYDNASHLTAVCSRSCSSSDASLSRLTQPLPPLPPAPGQDGDDGGDGGDCGGVVDNDDGGDCGGVVDRDNGDGGGDCVSREDDGNLDHLGCCSDALQQDWPVDVCEIVN